MPNQGRGSTWHKDKNALKHASNWVRVMRWILSPKRYHTKAESAIFKDFQRNQGSLPKGTERHPFQA
jgi:hypothetical protein